MVNARQFNILTEMGVQLWQQKTRHGTQVNVTTHDDAPSQNHTTTLTTLFSQPFFQDVLTCLSLTSGDVSMNTEQEKVSINLGFLTWQLDDTSSDISYENNTLTTPPIESFSGNVALKKQLWQVVNNHQLCD